MIVFAAAAVSLGCVLASARRLAFVLDAHALDPGLVLRALMGDAGRARYPRLRRALEGEPEGTWLKSVCSALERGGVEGAAALNEELGELDWRMGRWARVPRVCASIASSSGFLLASLALRQGLATATGSPDAALGDALHGVVGDALGVAAFGMAGTVWCIALQRQALALHRAAAAQSDKLVERIEAVARRDASAAPSGESPVASPGALAG